MKTNKEMSKQSMVRAWELRKQNPEYIWAECLKLAWKELRNEEFDITTLSRKELIQLMKEKHVKGWYRIYDKATMISRLLELAA